MKESEVYLIFSKFPGAFSRVWLVKDFGQSPSCLRVRSENHQYTFTPPLSPTSSVLFGGPTAWWCDKSLKSNRYLILTFRKALVIQGICARCTERKGNIKLLASISLWTEREAWRTATRNSPARRMLVTPLPIWLPTLFPLWEHVPCSRGEERRKISSCYSNGAGKLCFFLLPLENYNLPFSLIVQIDLLSPYLMR